MFFDNNLHLQCIGFENLWFITEDKQFCFIITFLFLFAVTNPYDGLKPRRRHPPKGTRRGRPKRYKPPSSTSTPSSTKESPSNGKLLLWGHDWM